MSTILWNGTERPIPLNTYFTEQLKNKPKQLPTLELLFWIDVDDFQVNTKLQIPKYEYHKITTIVTLNSNLV